MKSSILTVTNLVVTYGQIVAVKNVNFAVNRGEHLTLLGPSGCGKTTTLRAIAGLEIPSDGQIIIDGEIIYCRERRQNRSPDKRNLSMVFQSYAIWPHMSVGENVAFGLKVRGVTKSELIEAVKRNLALVGLEGYEDRRATDLSGGQQQRVALARAIAFDPKLILLDEPLSNLDAKLRASMRVELKALQRKLGLTAVYVTHDQEEAFAISDRVIIMRGGIVEQEGSPDELYHAPKSRFVADFIGASNVFDGEVQGMTQPDGCARVQISPGVIILCRDAPDTGKCTVCFRPAHVRLRENAPLQEGGARGRILRRVFLGDSIEYFIRTGEVEVRASVPSDMDFPEGSAVIWFVDPERCTVLKT